MNRTSHNLSHQEIQSLVGFNAKLILEIGCNDGTDTLEMLRQFPESMIFCFECDPRAIAKFKANVKDARAHLLEVAIDVTQGIKPFWQSDAHEDSPLAGWDKSGSLCKPTGHLQRSPEITFPRNIPVRTNTLDAEIERFIPPEELSIDFIRLDVQGNEGSVFAGGPRTLSRTRWMLAECHRQELYETQLGEGEMIVMLQGWKCHGRWADDLLFENLQCKRGGQ